MMPSTTMQHLIFDKNGVKIYWYFLKDVPIRISLYFRAGGIYQPKGKEGVAHLLEHIVVGESQKYPTLEQSQRYLNKEQLFFGGHTDMQFITFSGYCFNQASFKKLLNFIAEKINNTVIDQAKITREIAAIQNELANYSYDYPNTNQVILHDYLSTGSLDQKGIVEGDTASLESRISLQDLKEFKIAGLTIPSAIVVVGGIKPSAGNIAELEALFLKSTRTTLRYPARLRRTLQKRGGVIRDKIKNPTLSKSYIGFGWATNFSTKQNLLNSLIFMRALANPAGDLYALLRYKKQLIYDLSMDMSVVCEKYQLFSLHTSSDLEKISTIKKQILEYLDNAELIKRAIKLQLDIEKNMLGAMFDGSNSVGAYQNYFVSSGTSLLEFEAYIKETTVSSVFNGAYNNFDAKRVNILYS